MGRICLPAAEEFALLLRDKIRFWRLKNFLKIAKRAENLYNKSTSFEIKHAHPRLVSSILEHGSWSDDTIVQDMWAGLLASSCTLDGQDDSNLIFVTLLSQLTKSQAGFLKFFCETAYKSKDKTNLIIASAIFMPIDELFKISLSKNIHIIDRELDHLRSLGLIEGGIIIGANNARITPTPLALYMYVRCQGSQDSPVDYFDL